MSQIQGALVGIAMVCQRYLFQWHSSAVLLGQFTAVLYHHRFGNGAFCSGGIDSTPALCATLLKPVSAEHHENKAVSSAGLIPPSIIALTTTPKRRQNPRFHRTIFTDLCTNCAGMVVLFLRLPSSFLPEEDQVSF